MANKLFNTSDISAIASAIRAKNGSSDLYKVSEMASAIADIPTGGEWELEFFDYLTLDGGTGCKVYGTLQANNSYYIKVNNTSVVAATIHPILRTLLSDWTNWVSIYISGLRYYFGNNNGSQVGGDSANWSQLLGEHDYLYDGSGDITIDNGSTLSTYQYSNVSNSNVSEFIIGGNVGGSNSYHGQIEEFTISVSGNNIHHYVPCGIKHNGVLVDSGLYDTVTDKYYTSSGTATNTKIEQT